MSCKHCEFLFAVFPPANKRDCPDPLSPREYWIFTEMFCYLHGGKDYCESENLTAEHFVFNAPKDVIDRLKDEYEVEKRKTLNG